MKKPKAKQLSHTDVARLVDGLRTTVAFIEANIPPDVITTKQTYGLEKTRAAIHLTPDTDQNVSHMGLSLLWAIDFVMRNYEGECVRDGLPLHRGMDALEVLAGHQPAVACHVPCNMTGVGHDLV
jgi:hypothetical protein